jgi:threonine dehydratase
MITPQQEEKKLASRIGVPTLYLKREDLHPFGSHKGRSIPTMIEKYIKEGVLDFVISSSGNVALASILAIQKINKERKDPLSLIVYVGQQINKDKMDRLKKEITDKKIEIKQVERPKQKAFLKDKEGIAKNLRQSTDDTALLGYRSLAQELTQIPDLEAIFIPTSSGTTAEALGKYFQEFGKNVQIHIVQTESCNPIASEFMNWDKVNVNQSIAGAIVDNVSHRKDNVVNYIKQTGGSGWIIVNQEIENATQMVKENCDLDISSNSALSVAGLIKARETGWSWGGSVACLITGQ